MLSSLRSFVSVAALLLGLTKVDSSIDVHSLDSPFPVEISKHGYGVADIDAADHAVVDGHPYASSEQDGFSVASSIRDGVGVVHRHLHDKCDRSDIPLPAIPPPPFLSRIAIFDEFQYGKLVLDLREQNAGALRRFYYVHLCQGFFSGKFSDGLPSAVELPDHAVWEEIFAPVFEKAHTQKITELEVQVDPSAWSSSAGGPAPDMQALTRLPAFLLRALLLHDIGGGTTSVRTLSFLAPRQSHDREPAVAWAFFPALLEIAFGADLEKLRFRGVFPLVVDDFGRRSAREDSSHPSQFAGRAALAQLLGALLSRNQTLKELDLDSEFLVDDVEHIANALRHKKTLSVLKLRDVSPPNNGTQSPAVCWSPLRPPTWRALADMVGANESLLVLDLRGNLVSFFDDVERERTSKALFQSLRRNVGLRVLLLGGTSLKLAQYASLALEANRTLEILGVEPGTGNIYLVHELLKAVRGNRFSAVRGLLFGGSERGGASSASGGVVEESESDLQEEELTNGYGDRSIEQSVLSFYRDGVSIAVAVVAIVHKTNAEMRALLDATIGLARDIDKRSPRPMITLSVGLPQEGEGNQRVPQLHFYAMSGGELVPGGVSVSLSRVSAAWNANNIVDHVILSWAELQTLLRNGRRPPPTLTKRIFQKALSLWFGRAGASSPSPEEPRGSSRPSDSEERDEPDPPIVEVFLGTARVGPWDAVRLTLDGQVYVAEILRGAGHKDGGDEDAGWWRGLWWPSSFAFLHQHP